MGRTAINLLLFAVCFIVLFKEAVQLSPAGRNVCSRTHSYTSYVYERRTRVGYQTYYTSCGFWGWSRCGRSRAITVYYSQKVAVTRYKVHYFCCSGWSLSGNECLNAICSPTCSNGRCSAPNKCQCNTGWQGSYCHQDVNECTQSPCNQICNNLPGSYACSCKIGFSKPVADSKDRKCQDIDECIKQPCSCAPNSPGCNVTCENTYGSFRCQCNPGFRIVTGRVCTDFNECSIPGLSHCEHTCHNSIGSYFCSCRKGYLLASNKQNCTDINECATLNGGCTQICMNVPGSYHCQCKKGYQLTYDSKTCLDIDECKLRKPCDRFNGLCHNTPGSYYCSCQSGYHLAADNHTCNDDNECLSTSTNACSQLCHNADGTYFCSCRVGYYLGKDNRTCYDIDECKVEVHDCHHHCYNIPGSFYCGCRKGYKEQPDGRSCQALPCQTILAPKDGLKDCTGYVTDQHCIFRCNQGFQLFGSSNRTCTPSLIWSGEPASCSKKSCPPPQPPPRGGVAVPCDHEYNSTCFLSCTEDHYLIGSETIKCQVNKTGSTFWNIEGTCKAVELCNVNPCKHGGKCHPISRRTFKCRCEGTGYRGPLCEEGYLDIPPTSRLTVGTWSGDLWYGARPEVFLQVRLIVKHGYAVIEPSFLVFSKFALSRSIRIKALAPGKIEIAYMLFGEDVFYFTPPENTVFYAHVDSELKSPVTVTPNLLTIKCHLRNVGECQNGGLIKIGSTCPWVKTTGYGIISIHANGYAYPMSLIGIDITSFPDAKYLSPKSQVSAYLSTQTLSSCDISNACTNLTSTKASVSFAQSYDLFIHSYHEEFSKNTPNWLDLRLDFTDKLPNEFQPNDMYSELGTISHFPDIFDDSLTNGVATQLYSVFTTAKRSILRIFANKKNIGGSSNYHLASGICDSFLLLKFDHGSEVNVTDELLSTGLVTIKTFIIHKVVFDTYMQRCVPVLQSEGIREKCLMPGVVINLTVAFQFDQESYLEFGGRFMITAATSDDVMLSGATKPLESIFHGTIFSKHTINLGNTTLTITALDNNTSGFLRFGGPPDSSYQKAGISFQLETSTLQFSYISSLLILKPTSSHVYTRYLYGVTGGKIINVGSTNTLILTLKLLNRTVDPHFPSIRKLLDSRFDTDYALLSQRGHQVFWTINNLIKTMQRKASFVEVLKKVKRLQGQNFELELAFRSLEKRLVKDPVFKQVKQALILPRLYLKKIELLDVVPLRTKVNSTFAGFQMYFVGAICVRKLCFNPMTINVSSKRSPIIHQNRKFDDLTLVAKVNKDVWLNSRIRLERNNQLFVSYQSKDDILQGNFAAKVLLFGKEYNVLFRFNKGKISYSIPKVLINGLLCFDIHGDHSLSQISWERILETVQGEANQGGNGMDKLFDGIHGKMQSYFKKTGNYTKLRLEHSKYRINQSHNAISTLEKKSAALLQGLLSLEENLRLAKLLHNRDLAIINRSQTILRSYQEDLSTNFIEKSLERLCKLKTCNKTCISMPVKKICQDPVSLPVTLEKCEEVSQKVPTKVIEPYQTQCPVRKYFFETVYTGSCKEDPNARAQREVRKREALVSAGQGVGSLIGFVLFGGAGAAIGGILGGAVGFVLSLFGSCDSTYEVYERSWIEQEQCTKLKEDVILKDYKYSECCPVTTSVQSGYAQPKVCGHEFQNCVAIVDNPVCVTQNLKCQEFRTLYLSTNQSVPKRYLDEFLTLQRTQNNLQITLSEIRRLQNEQTLQGKKYNEHLILLQRERRSYKIAVNLHSEMIQSLSSDICVQHFYQSSSNIRDHLSITKFTINTSLALVDSVVVEAHFDVIHNNKHNKVLFLAHFQDEEGYLKTASKEIIYSGLCGSKRKRRSAAETTSLSLPFISWYQEARQNTSREMLSCLTFKRALGYLVFVANDLHDTAKNWSALNEELLKAGNHTLQYNLTSTDNDLSVNQWKEINTIVTYINATQSENTVKQLIEEWKSNSEVFTGLSNTTACFNLEDCIHIAIDSLRDLPSMLRVKRKEFDQELSAVMEILIVKLNEVVTVDELKRETFTLTTKLRYIEEASLVCTEKPHVSMNLNSTVFVAASTVVNMTCSVQSSLPVIFSWLKDDKVIEGEQSSRLSFKAENTSRGFYQCVAISLAGRAISNGTLLIVEHSPKLLEGPKSRIHWVPSPSVVIPYFVCNGTGNPDPEITWYQRDHNTSTVKILSGAVNQSIYSPSLLDNSSGYIYCELSNAIGRIKSDMARLDVVYQYPAQQELHFGFNFTDISGNGTNVSFSELRQRMQVDSQVSVIYRLKGDAHLRSVHFVLSSSPSEWENGSHPENFFPFASKSRQQLANSVSLVMNEILTNGSHITADNERHILVDNNTLTVNYHQLCRAGYYLKKNGFVCGQCLPGSYERDGKCILCPSGTYQPFSGQNFCTRCPDSKTTISIGSTEILSCIYPDLCTTGKHNCHQNAECTMVGPYLACRCLSGFTGNGTHCSLTDLCVTGLHNCHKNAECTTDGNNYRCRCQSSFTGNGTMCFLINNTVKYKDPSMPSQTLVIGIGVAGVLLLFLIAGIFIWRLCKRFKSSSSIEKKPDYATKSFENKAYDNELHNIYASAAILPEMEQVSAATIVKEESMYS